VLDDPGGHLEPGDVLVCTATSPAWTRLLSVAGAVVTETGTLLSHAAIVAREFGIPAVVSVGSATTLLVDGSTVTVDGWQGTVADASPGPGGDQP
jgi:phosphoenolpyruvate synthase/pyruvate phosphate dikinase